MQSKSFVVVGAGVGGLATALRLAHKGHRVTVLEKNDQVGGRNRERIVGGVKFDAGPTLMMMLDPFRKLFADVGENLDDHLDLVQCDPNYRVFFSDGARLDCTSNMAKMVRQIELMSGPQDASRYPAMLGEFGALYHASMLHFVRRNYDSPLDLVRPKSLYLALKHRMLGNLADGISRYYDDPRLHMLFSLQTMYLGLSPFQAPFVYAVLVYMEYGEGIWYPMGGMVEISRAIARLAETKGVEIRLESPVREVSGNSVLLESGERISADAVIINADLPYAEKNLLASLRPKSASEQAEPPYAEKNLLAPLPPNGVSEQAALPYAEKNPLAPVPPNSASEQADLPYAEKSLLAPTTPNPASEQASRPYAGESLLAPTRPNLASEQAAPPYAEKNLSTALRPNRASEQASRPYAEESLLAPTRPNLASEQAALTPPEPSPAPRGTEGPAGNVHLASPEAAHGIGENMTDIRALEPSTALRGRVPRGMSACARPREDGQGGGFSKMQESKESLLSRLANALLAAVSRKRDRRYSCSAYMMYIDYLGEIPELLHHNILLGGDFDNNLAQLFSKFEIPTDPAFYAAISSKTDPERAQPGHENLFILVPCPNLTHEFTDADALDLQEKVFRRLEKETSFRRDQIANMETTTPHDWASELNLDRGAAFGLSHDLLQSVCFRPSNKSKSQDGLYFVGASTTPGNGLPMVLIGAELVERRLQTDGLI